jgi:hypothetical protein
MDFSPMMRPRDRTFYNNNILRHMALVTSLLLVFLSGCAALPDIREEPRFHNPFPQIHRVAILPFFNLSTEPTLNGEEVALAYYNEMQLIPGFDVMPIGVAKQKLMANQVIFNEATDFQQIARDLKVEAVLVGAITDFQSYYPPRMGLKVSWYAANPGFHPIPPGYGLPWGTSEEEFIPDDLVFDAEFALARKQLETQTPVDGASASVSDNSATSNVDDLGPDRPVSEAAAGENLPDGWPDPKGFIPSPPSPTRPAMSPQNAPIIKHTRIYNGHDESFTNRLSQYYFFRDDRRFGGWQAYLQRSEDFIRFCCYLHLTETLASRGGASESRVVWRWPLDRYER